MNAGPSTSSPGVTQSATRWVARVGNDVPRTRFGLVDSARLERGWSEDERPNTALALAGAADSYVLLAPGGAGKTTIVSQLKSLEDGCESFDLRMHTPATTGRALSELVSRASTIFIDAVDEALLLDPNFDYALATFLSSPAASSVRWRLTCRPGSWTGDLDVALRALPKFQALELLPLSLANIHQIAGDDAAQFISDVAKAHLTHLLARPFDVRAMLLPWRDGNGLPSNQSDSMRFAVARLLAESGGFRPPPMQGDDQMGEIAQRLAAISMFSGVDRFTLSQGRAVSVGAESEGPSSGALSASAVPTDPEPGTSTNRLQVEHVREVLRTSLFAAAGDGSVRFAHQSFAEFLAASYLTRRGVSGCRLISLLGADANHRTPGSMIEVLGWLLALGGDVPHALLAENVKELLLTAGLQVSGETTRSQIVRAVLEGAASGLLDEGWSIDASGLRHSELGQQLREVVSAPANRWVVFWVCRIARDCQVSDIADELLALAMSDMWPGYIRAEAIEAFAAVVEPSRRSELEPLLGLSEIEDPQFDLAAAALRAVLPDHVPVETIGSALQPYNGEGYIGDYTMLLEELPSMVNGDDVLVLLEHALDNVEEHNRTSDLAMGRLIAGLVRRAWAMKSESVAAELGRLLSRQAFPRQNVFRMQAMPWEADPDNHVRRHMAASVMARGERAALAVWRQRMLTMADLDWLIALYALTSEPERPGVGLTLQQMAASVTDAASADRVLTVGPDEPAYAVLSRFQGVRDLETDRPEWLALDESEPGESPDIAVQVKRLRDAMKTAADNLTQWFEVVNALCGQVHPGRLESWFEPDLTIRSLWPHLNDGDRAEVLSGGVQYLNVHEPRPAEWVDLKTYNLRQVMPDRAGTYLLVTLCKHRPEMASEISRTTWDRWAATVLQTPQFQHEWRREMWDAAGTQAREALRGAMYELIRTGASVDFEHHPVIGRVDDGEATPAELVEALVGLASDVTQPADRRDCALRVLRERSRDAALAVARAVLHEDEPPVEATGLLASLAPQEMLEPWLARDQLPPLAWLDHLTVDGLDDASVFALGALLAELPPADDPADVTSRGGAPESNARRLRDHLLQTMSRRGMADELAALAGQVPDEDRGWVQRWLQQARIEQAVSAWAPIAPATLMSLLGEGDARLIRNDSGLMAVLVEQLNKIQHDLSHLGLFSGMWDGFPGSEGASAKAEDFISSYLRQQLEVRLSPHVVIDREVEVARSKAAGSGTRIDITATSGGQHLGRVLVEAKHVYNASLLTAIDEQLVQRYLDPMTATHGIYLVYWAAPEVRGKSATGSHPEAGVLRKELQAQADRHLPRLQIQVYVLDIGPPASSAE